MDAILNNDRYITVYIDASEVRLIMKALDVLRYSDEHLNGWQLVNLAGLSMEWRAMTQDIAAGRQTPAEDVVRLMKRLHRIGKREDGET